jgi:PH/SEC7 domain-containing protein
MGKSAMANPMDKIHINDWTAPVPALVPSTLEEEAQLEALQSYSKQLRGDMDGHKALEEPMYRQVRLLFLYSIAPSRPLVESGA